MRIEFFNEQMDRLRGLRFVPSSLETHWEALQQLPEVVLEAAVTRAQRTRVEFPTPVDLRRDADDVAPQVQHLEPLPDQSEDLPEPVDLGTLPDGTRLKPATRLWRYYCDRCSDLGQASWWCGDEHSRRQPWIPFGRCPRRGEHGAHEWTTECACAASNPAVLRKREQQVKYAPASFRGAA